MKKLPLCALFGSALFAIAGTIVLAKVAPRPEPFPLFFPLMWDLVMVGVSVGIVLRCQCARCAGIVWGVFCIVASLVIGAVAFGWLWPQEREALSVHRWVFMGVTIAFGLGYGIWQLIALHSPEGRVWTHSDSDVDRRSQPHHG